MSEPTVTVVVPTHDRRELLAETVRRALAQTVPVEVVVVDDGSRDDTARWLAHMPVRVVHHDTARGGGLARNAGAATARTRWVAFCDDDDLWAPTKLAEQLTALRARPEARWSATGCVFIDGDGRLVGAQSLRSPETVVDQLRSGNAIPGGGSSLLVERQLFIEVGGFAPDLDGAHDWELAIRIAALSPLAYVDRPLVAYRRWPGNRSRDTHRAARVRAEILARHDLPPIPNSGGVWHEHEARLAAEAGSRRAAAGAWLSAAVALRAPGQLLYAAGALIAPQRVLARLTALDVAAAPPGWLAEARVWVEDRGQ